MNQADMEMAHYLETSHADAPKGHRCPFEWTDEEHSVLLEVMRLLLQVSGFRNADVHFTWNGALGYLHFRYQCPGKEIREETIWSFHSPERRLCTLRALRGDMLSDLMPF